MKRKLQTRRPVSLQKPIRPLRYIFFCHNEMTPFVPGIPPMPPNRPNCRLQMCFQDPSIPERILQSLSHNLRVSVHQVFIPLWELSTRNERDRYAILKVVLPVGEVY